MNIKYLETFLTLAGNLNFTKSAEQLFISQPAISRQISTLEKEIGYPLFERTKRSVALTPHGEELIDHAKKLLEDYENLLNHMEEIGAKSSMSLSIGLMNDLYNDMISKKITRYASEHPQTQVMMEFMSTPRLFDRLHERSLDVAFTMIHPDMDMQALSYLEIGEQKLKLAVHKSHPKATATEPINLSDFKDERLVCISKESNQMAYDHVKHMVKGSHMLPKKITYSSTVTHLVAKVNCGLGITMITETPDLVMPYDIVLLEIDHPKAYAKAVVVWDDENPKISDSGLLAYFHEQSQS